LGDKTSRCCILNTEGEVSERGSFHNSESSLKKHFGSLMGTRMEMETGTQSGWISRFLKSDGHEVLVAHARDRQGIGRSDRKLLVNNARGLAKTEGSRLPAAITVDVWSMGLEVLKGDMPSRRSQPA
jgi:hypothetical protein